MIIYFNHTSSAVLTQMCYSRAEILVGSPPQISYNVYYILFKLIQDESGIKEI